MSTSFFSWKPFSILSPIVSDTHKRPWFMRMPSLSRIPASRSRPSLKGNTTLGVGYAIILIRENVVAGPPCCRDFLNTKQWGPSLERNYKQLKMGSALPKGAWGRSFQTGTERIDVSDAVSKTVLTFAIWFSNNGMIWFYWKSVYKGIVLSQAWSWGAKEFTKEDIDYGEHSGASSSGEANRKFHCSSYPGPQDARWALCRDSNHGDLLNSKLNHRKETKAEDGMLLIEKVSFFFSPPKFQLQIFCSYSWVVTQETGYREKSFEMWQLIDLE